MLKRANRLPARTRLTQSKKFYLDFALVKKAANTVDVNRFAFVISKKTAPHAVDRNRCKRLISACIEGMLPDMSGSNDYLFIISKNINNKKASEIYEDIRKVLFEG